jgi:hypothetical protein
MQHPWQGDWKKRILERIMSQGHSSVITFAEAHAGATFFELAKRLGDGVAPIQVEQLISEAYYEDGNFERYARSALVRHLRSEMPNGWKVDNNFDFERVCAFTDWKLRLPDDYKEATERVWGIFKQVETIPKGWFPQGPDDPVITEIFRRAKFGSKSKNR